MAKRTTTSDPQSVTGVASGSLGTGTALDDTQRYSIAELGTPDEVDNDAVPAPEDAEPARAVATAAADARGGTDAQGVTNTPIGRSEPAAPIVPPPATNASATRAAAAAVPAAVSPAAPASPIVTSAEPAVAPVPRTRTRRAMTGGYPARPLAVAAIVLVVVAAALTLRDGGLVGGSGPGGFAGADSFPPAPSAGLVVTPVVTPAPKPAPAGHGNGHGNGNGNGQH